MRKIKCIVQATASNSIPWQVDGTECVPRSQGRSSIEKFSAGLILSIDTSDFDEFREYAVGWTIEYQSIGTKQPHSIVSGVMTSSVQIALVQHAMGYCSQGQNPKGTLTIPVPLDEARPMVLRGRGIDQMHLSLIRSSEGYELICGSGSSFLISSVAQGRAEQYAADIWHRPELWRHSTGPLHFPDGAHRQRYIDTCRNIVSAVKAQPSLLQDPCTANVVEDQFLENLLLEAYADPQSAEERSRYKVARQAYQYLQDHTDDVPSVRDLCAYTGASYATLERGFREIYGMSPKAMMTALRLSRARRQLLRPGGTTTVTAVALRWGFVEFGRFSALYRMRFGETPRETLRRALGTPSNLIGSDQTP